MDHNAVQYTDLAKAVEFVLCLPGTTVPVERVFSIMNDVWSPEKSCLNIATMKTVLRVRVNASLDCTAFYDKLLIDKKTLKKIASSKKYNWCQAASHLKNGKTKNNARNY
ncbi:unnamed protein product [Caretta caretta]